MYLNIEQEGLAESILCEAVITSDTGEFATVTALWDTGATGSMITEDIAKKLCLEDAGSTKYFHAAGIAETRIYLAAVEIQGGLKINRIELPAMIGDHDIDLIIGMDVITRGEFNIKNVNGNTVFTFTS